MFWNGTLLKGVKHDCQNLYPMILKKRGMTARGVLHCVSGLA
jgi:hypothetical protein